MNDRGADAVETARSLTEEASALIESHAGLVYGLVKRFEGRGTEREELIQSGFVGLAAAAAGFDASRGAAFSSYAFKFVEGAMRECIRNDTLIKLPRSEYAALAKRGMISDEEREADEAERTEKLFKIEARSRPLPLTVYNRAGEESVAPIEELAVYEGFEESSINAAHVREALKKLEPMERRVIILRFFHEKTQEKTAKMLQISQASVSRAEKSALLKLRALMER